MLRTREDLPVARRQRQPSTARKLPIGPVVVSVSVALGGALAALFLGATLAGPAAPAFGVDAREIVRMQAALEERPEDAALLTRLAASYKDNKQMNEARMVYEKLHQMKPNDQDLLKQYKVRRGDV